MICDECKANCSLINGIYVCRNCGLEHGPELSHSMIVSTGVNFAIKLSPSLPCIGNYHSEKERLRAKFYNIASRICQIARLPNIVVEESVRIAIKNWKGESNSIVHVLSAIIYVSMNMGGVYMRLPEEWEVVLSKMDLRRPGRASSNGDHKPIGLMSIMQYIYRVYGKLPDRSKWYWERLSFLFPRYLIKRASRIIERPRNLKEAIAALILADYEKVLCEEDLMKIKEMAKISIKKAKILSKELKKKAIKATA